MPIIRLIRHGQASFGAADYDQLSPLGERQSALLGAWLNQAAVRPARVVMGSMRRHRQTMQGCMDVLGGPLAGTLEMPDFNEFDHEEVLARYKAEYAGGTGLKDLIEQSADPRRAFQDVFSAAVTRWVAGEANDYQESWVDFKARCRRGLAALVEQPVDGETWVFTSGGVIAMLSQVALELSDAATMRVNWTLANSGVTLLHARPGQIRMGFLNNYAHLEQRGQRDLISYR